jgi:hypothetical protein
MNANMLSHQAFYIYIVRTFVMVAKKKTQPEAAGKPDSGPADSNPFPAFPKKELNKWLKAHKTWGHDDWLELLEDLKAKGYGNLVSDQAGQDSVGLYLETNRNNK